MATYQTQGCTLAVGNGDGPPETFDNVGEVQSISGPDGTAPEIDTTSLSSTARTFNMGLPEEGNVTLEVNLDPDDAQQTELRTKRAAQTVNNYQITLTDSPATTLTFAAYVTGFSVNVAIDDVIKASITLRITGAVTWA